MDLSSLPIHAALAAALAALPPGDAAGPQLSSLDVAAADLPRTVQVLEEAIPWTWPQMGPNQLSLQQFYFSDTQPQDCADGASFRTSSSSVSGAYSSFLQLIDAKKFTPSDLLIKALVAATPPSRPPADGGRFPGWIAVPNSGGLLDYRPEYSVALTPSEWRATFGSPVTAAGSPRAFVVQSPHVTALDGQISAAEISATSVVRVPIYPGAWYSDWMVVLAADGPFAEGVGSDMVIGDKGILRCRITEMFIASGLSASVTVPDDAVPAMADHVATPQARVGLLAIEDAANTTVRPAAAGGHRYIVAADPKVPFIVGVTVQRFGQ